MKCKAGKMLLQNKNKREENRYNMLCYFVREYNTMTANHILTCKRQRVIARTFAQTNREIDIEEYKRQAREKYEQQQRENEGMQFVCVCAHWMPD
jgi:hypothetical protein